jgi:hypothetical protein
MTIRDPLTFEDLLRMRLSRLADVHAAGTRPDPAALAGQEYRGVNRPATAGLLGIRRFVKGFATQQDGSVHGYNKRVPGRALDRPWTAQRRTDGRVAYAPFVVLPGPDDTEPGAVLLDYGAAPDPEPGVAARLRDVLVRANPGSDDLLLGRAYLALRGRRIPVGWFVLDHLGPGDPDRC